VIAHHSRRERRLREDLCLEAAEAIEAHLGLATPIDPVR
jgi:amidase